LKGNKTRRVNGKNKKLKEEESNNKYKKQMRLICNSQGRREKKIREGKTH
jgi:hypothetical protein